MSPSVSKKQQGFFGSELARRRAGKKSKVANMSDEQVEEFAATKTKNLPKKAKAKKK